MQPTDSSGTANRWPCAYFTANARADLHNQQSGGRVSNTVETLTHCVRTLTAGGGGGGPGGGASATSCSCSGVNSASGGNSTVQAASSQRRKRLGAARRSPSASLGAYLKPPPRCMQTTPSRLQSALLRHGGFRNSRVHCSRFKNLTLNSRRPDNLRKSLELLLATLFSV